MERVCMKKLFTIFTLFVMLASMSSCGLSEAVETVLEFSENAINNNEEEFEIDITDPNFDINNLPFDPHDSDVSTLKKLQEVTRQMSLEILDCFDNHDKQKLMEMFAPGISAKYDLNYQIDRAFEIYDSNSVTYERLDTESSSSTKKDGIYTKVYMRGQFARLECEDGNKYWIVIGICFVNDDEPDQIGVTKIYLQDEDGVNLRIIGEYNKDEVHLVE